MGKAGAKDVKLISVTHYTCNNYYYILFDK